MPCLILTGYPCSGKTTLAHLIRDVALQHFQESITSVLIVNDATACPNLRDGATSQGYTNSAVEKSTRASLKSEFDRVVNGGGGGGAGRQVADDADGARTSTSRTQRKRASSSTTTLVILDSLNYIKGYRYELYCITKAAQRRHGVVWVVNTLDTVLSWNQHRSPVTQRYDENLLRQLVARYEPPDARNRWDSPLYVIDVRDAPPSDPTPSGDPNGPDTTTTKPSQSSVLEEVLEHSVYDMHKLSSTLPNKEKTPIQPASTTTMSDAAMSASDSPPTTLSAQSANSAKASTSIKPKRAVFKRPTKKTTAPPAASADSNNTVNGTTSTFMSLRAARDAEPSAVVGSPASVEVVESPAQANVATTQSLEERVIDMLRAFLSDDNKPLQAGTSTTRHEASDPNTLNQIDSITLQVCDALSKSGGTTTTTHTTISVLGETFAVSTNGGMHRTLSLPELRRLRRQYMQWVATYPPDDVDATTPSSIVKSFLAYVDTQRR